MSYNYNPMAANQIPMMPALLASMSHGAVSTNYLPHNADALQQHQMTLAAAMAAGSHHHEFGDDAATAAAAIAEYNSSTTTAAGIHNNTKKTASLLASSAEVSTTASSSSSASVIIGAGPMDLETASESLPQSPPIMHGQSVSCGASVHRRRRSPENGCCDDDRPISDTSLAKHNQRNTELTQQQQQQLYQQQQQHQQQPPPLPSVSSQSSSTAAAAMMFNGMLGLGPQSLMLMPGMMNMMDAATASQLMLHQQQQQQQQQQHPQFPRLSQLAQPAPPSATTAASIIAGGGGSATAVQNDFNGNCSQPPHTTAVNAISSTTGTNMLIPTGNNNNASNSNGINAAAAPASAVGLLKEAITCKTCALFPPNPNQAAPSTRERPPGCRTVFVGGLPENVTEEHIREIFERCGDINTLRLSKKNFCHIRFAHESAVDSAIYLSGYRIRLGAHTDAANCGRMHVDFAQARDDQYEWECKQRQLQREQRHRERCDSDRARGPQSPPPVVHYTDHEAAVLADRLKHEEQFVLAMQVLIVWLERGDCSKKNANTFYSMVQSTNAHLRRLQTERATYEEALQSARDAYQKQMSGMSGQFSQIEKVFGAASHKKVWDHFTKAQRKNIDLWKKQSMELRTSQMYDGQDNDGIIMELSDDDRDSRSRSSKRAKFDNQSLQLENEHLKHELSAYRSDADMAKSMLEQDTDIMQKQLKVLQETIRNLQTQLMENNAKEKESMLRIGDLETRLRQANVKELLLKTKIVEAATNNKQSNNINHINSLSSSSSKSSLYNATTTDVDDGAAGMLTEQSKSVASSASADAMDRTTPPTTTASVTSAIGSSVRKAEPIETDEARIIGLVAAFLTVHPFGASLDYIYSYVQRSAPHLRPKQLEEILSRHVTTFSEQVSGVGANIERKWNFCGFNIDQRRE